MNTSMFSRNESKLITFKKRRNPNDDVDRKLRHSHHRPLYPPSLTYANVGVEVQPKRKLHSFYLVYILAGFTWVVSFWNVPSFRGYRTRGNCVCLWRSYIHTSINLTIMTQHNTELNPRNPNPCLEIHKNESSILKKVYFPTMSYNLEDIFFHYVAKVDTSIFFVVADSCTCKVEIHSFFAMVVKGNCIHCMQSKLQKFTSPWPRILRSPVRWQHSNSNGFINNNNIFIVLISNGYTNTSDVQLKNLVTHFFPILRKTRKKQKSKQLTVNS
jgi:hypothetical protein